MPSTRDSPGCMNANDSSETGEVPLTCNAGAAVPATIVLTRRNFEVAELVTPIAGCGLGRAGRSLGWMGKPARPQRMEVPE